MFKVAKFDRNNDADFVCKELFKKKNHHSSGTKITKGKITKRTKKSSIFKNKGKIKDGIKNVLNNSEFVQQTKIKIKKNQRHIPPQSNSKNATFNIQNDKQFNNTERVEKQKKKRKKKVQKTDGEIILTKALGNEVTTPRQRKKKGKLTKDNETSMIPKGPTISKQKKMNKEKTDISLISAIPKISATSKQKKKRKKKENNETSTNSVAPEDPLTAKQKKRKRKKTENNETSTPEVPLTLKQRKKDKLKGNILEMLQTSPKTQNHPKTKNLSLRERMMQRLQAARFRYINEQIYSTDSKQAQKIFREDPDAFRAYHEGYRQQVSKWPLNPLDVIIKSIQQLPRTFVVADFGCGDAKLAQSVTQKVHSFDLVAQNENVIACDMAHVPLEASSVDVVVFCLSLMGTNLHDYLLEANRVLKLGGVVKIAEVESRFDDVKQFIEAVQRFHFKNTWKDLSHNLFYFLDFKKESNIKNKKKLPLLNLNPCLYKKR